MEQTMPPTPQPHTYSAIYADPPWSLQQTGMRGAPALPSNERRAHPCHEPGRASACRPE